MKFTHNSQQLHYSITIQKTNTIKSVNDYKNDINMSRIRLDILTVF